MLMNEPRELPQPSDGPGETPVPQGPAKAYAKANGGEPSREDRLKAALKANMARRKAQAKARGAKALANENEKE